MSGVAAADQYVVPELNGDGGGAGKKQEDETYKNYDKTAWHTRLQSGEEVFWFRMNNNIPLTTSFLTKVAGEMGLDELGLDIITKYISRSNRQNIATLLVKSRRLQSAVDDVLTGIGNKFDAKQLVLEFGESFNMDLKRNKQRVPLEKFYDKDGMQPQFKKRRVWRGNTQQEVTPQQQHKAIQKIFCVAVAKRMALDEQKKQYQLALGTSGAERTSLVSLLSELKTEYAYLLSRIRNASWVQLSPGVGFLTETPKLYAGAKSFAVGQLSYEKKEGETNSSLRKRYERIMKGYKKKNQRNRVPGTLNRTLTLPWAPGDTPHRTRRQKAADRLKKNGSTGRIELNYK